jgi:ankyrin repeat protein
VGMGQVDRSDDDGRTPMFVAAGQGHTTAVEALAAAGADCTKAHVEGYSPLYAAAQEGHLETVQALVAVGAALDQTTNEADTPLMIASLVRAIDAPELSIGRAREGKCGTCGKWGRIGLDKGRTFGLCGGECGELHRRSLHRLDLS